MKVIKAVKRTWAIQFFNGIVTWEPIATINAIGYMSWVLSHTP